MALFTGKGDKGDTSLFGSKERVSKASCQTEALGTLDEINTLLGVCKAKARNFEYKMRGRSIPTIIEEVQQDLFIIQAVSAGGDKELTRGRTQFLEDIINAVDGELPPIKSFFLPGGTELSSLLDYARAVSRRAERIMVRKSEEDKVPAEVLIYMNRLSSLLYALVRFVNYKQDVKEVPPSY